VGRFALPVRKEWGVVLEPWLGRKDPAATLPEDGPAFSLAGTKEVTVRDWDLGRVADFFRGCSLPSTVLKGFTASGMEVTDRLAGASADSMAMVMRTPTVLFLSTHSAMDLRGLNSLLCAFLKLGAEPLLTRSSALRLPLLVGPLPKDPTLALLEAEWGVCLRGTEPWERGPEGGPVLAAGFE